MRDLFHEELEQINLNLVSLGGQIKVALDSATHALLTADLALAEKTYGVPARYIVGILGVETYFGEHQGLRQSYEETICK